MILALLAAAAFQCPDGSPPPCGRASRAPAPSPNSVAVLYLNNLSRDSSDAFLADALTEEIIIRLGQVPRLDVKSLFEVERVRQHANQDPAVLGRTLRATYLVTGSVQRAGERVRVRYEVVRAVGAQRVAGDVIDRSSGDLLSLESDIAGAVATAITGHLLPDEQHRLARPLTSSAAAYEQYLRGIQAAHNFGDEAALRSAVSFFNHAIALDSGFASAYAGKSLAWSMLADGYVTPIEGYGQTRIAAGQALARDSSNALSWGLLANAAFALDLDAPACERLARRGLALDPHSGFTRSMLAWGLWAQGKPDSAIAEARRAWLSDSLYVIISVSYMTVLLHSGHLDTAAAMVPRIRAVLPASDADALEGMVLGTRGDSRGAARLLDWRYYGGAFSAGMYVRALVALGDTAKARATVDSMLAARTPGYYNPVALARAYTALGDLDRAFEWLERALDERTAMVVWMRQDTELAPLRADPRYAALDRQLRF